MSTPISKADIAGVWSMAEVNRWAKNDDSNVDTAIANGLGEIRSAVGNRFDVVKFDALAADTMPSLVKGYAIDLASEWLSRGNKREPALEAAADKARAWLGLIVAGRDHTFDGILTPLGSATGGASARVGTSRRRFDADDPCSSMARHTRFR